MKTQPTIQPTGQSKTTHTQKKRKNNRKKQMQTSVPRWSHRYPPMYTVVHTQPRTGAHTQHTQLSNNEYIPIGIIVAVGKSTSLGKWEIHLLKRLVQCNFAYVFRHWTRLIAGNQTNGIDNNKRKISIPRIKVQLNKWNGEKNPEEEIYERK